MPYFIKIDEKSDLEQLKLHLERRLDYFRSDVSAYVDFILVYERLVAAVADAKKADAVQIMERTRAKPTKQVTKEKKKMALAIAPCKEHPTYGAKRSPRTECKTCWDAYEKYCGPSRAQLARIKFDREHTTQTTREAG